MQNNADIAISASHALIADNSISSSYALTASYALNSLPQESASYAATATSASYALTASYALNVPNIDTGSLLSTASISDATITFEKADASTFDLIVDNVVSSSYASFANNSNTSLESINASSATTAVSASYALNALTASYALEVDELDYVYVKGTGTNDNLSTGDDITFWNVRYNQGEITYNGSGGFVLKSGKKYELEAGIWCKDFTNATDGSAYIKFSKVGDGGFHDTSGIYYPTTYNTAHSPTTIITAFASPTTDMTINLNVILANGSFTADGNASYIKIKEIR